nr:hypothetical protein [Tanacetum cinerariifolium]
LIASVENYKKLQKSRSLKTRRIKKIAMETGPGADCRTVQGKQWDWIPTAKDLKEAQIANLSYLNYPKTNQTGKLKMKPENGIENWKTNGLKNCLNKQSMGACLA